MTCPSEDLNCPGRPASPPCEAADADDSYMGFAPGSELVAALNELLEAERAGVAVALASSGAASSPAHARWLRALHADEARWCGMLSGWIARLGAQPSAATGAFRDQALAISDAAERIAFIQRGQAWVARRIDGLLPRVRSDALHADLRAMRDAHRTMIDAAPILSDGARR